MTVFCPHLAACDGCPRFGKPSVSNAVLARLGRMAGRAGIQLSDPEFGDPAGYRHRARLAVRGSGSHPRVGLFQNRTHNIVDIPECHVHHPLINEVAANVKQTLRETGVMPYHDVRHAGLLRYLQVVVERQSQRAQVVVVGNCDNAEPLAHFLRALERRTRALHSLWFNGNPLRHNTILGETWQRYSGPPAVVEVLGGAKVFFPPAAFGQANLALFESILATIQRWVPAGCRLVEYHAGVGAIGLGLANRAAALTCVEVAPGGIQGLELGIVELADDVRRRVAVRQGTAAEHAALAGNADLVIVDPPRKGLEPALTRVLAEQPPERLIYLSCGLGSFERDAAALLAGGRLGMSALRAYALFPFTEHVETLALFERR